MADPDPLDRLQRAIEMLEAGLAEIQEAISERKDSEDAPRDE